VNDWEEQIEYWIYEIAELQESLGWEVAWWRAPANVPAYAGGFKGVGMRWSETGFNHLLHLRLAWVNGRFEELFALDDSPN
jgi:hypothetical protein